MSFGYSVLGMGAHPQGGEETVYVYDTFTDTDNLIVSSHTPDIDVEGGGWINSGYGVSVINNNEFNTQLTVANSLYLIDIGSVSDFTVEFTVVNPNNYILLVARSANAITSGWYVYFGLNGDFVQFYENGTKRDDADSPVVAGDVMKLVLLGTSIKYYLNDNLVIDYTATGALGSGNYVGIQAGGGGAAVGARVDNFKAYNPA